MEGQRDRLSRALRGWLRERPPSRSRLQPLSTSFTARIAYCARGALAMAGTVVLVAQPTVVQHFAGTVLLPVCAAMAVQPTLGASIAAAARASFGGLMATAFDAAVMALFPSGSRWGAVAAVAVFVALMTYSAFSVAAKRIGIAVAVIGLMRHFGSEASEGPMLAARTMASVAAGCCLGVLAALLPMPVVATSSTELSIRTQLAVAAVRRQAAALVLVVSHPRAAAAGTPAIVFAAQAGRDYSRYGWPADGCSPDSDCGGGADCGTQPLRTPDTDRVPAAQAEAPFENMKARLASAPVMDAEHRAPLLRADVEDMHAESGALLAATTAMLPDLAWELTGWGPTLVWWCRRWWRRCMSCLHACMRGKSRRCCCTKPAFRAPGDIDPGDDCRDDATAHVIPRYTRRVHLWLSAANRLNRIIGAMIASERRMPGASGASRAFLAMVEAPLCGLAHALGDYAVAAAAHALVMQYPCGAVSCCSIIGRPAVSRRDSLKEVAALAGLRAAVFVQAREFVAAFRAARAAVLYEPSTGQTKAPIASPAPPWHIYEMLPLHTFLFSVLRLTQTVLATAALTAPPDPHQRVKEAPAAATPSDASTAASTPSATIGQRAGFASQERRIPVTALELERVGEGLAIAPQAAAAAATAQATGPLQQPAGFLDGVVLRRTITNIVAQLSLRQSGDRGASAATRGKPPTRCGSNCRRVCWTAATLSRSCLCHATRSCHRAAVYFGFVPNWASARAAIKMTLAVCLATAASLLLHDQLSTAGVDFSYWAGVTASFMLAINEVSGWQALN
jgi:hypothetical protein